MEKSPAAMLPSSHQRLPMLFPLPAPAALQCRTRLNLDHSRGWGSLIYTMYSMYVRIVHPLLGQSCKWLLAPRISCQCQSAVGLASALRAVDGCQAANAHRWRMPQQIDCKRVSDQDEVIPLIRPSGPANKASAHNWRAAPVRHNTGGATILKTPLSIPIARCGGRLVPASLQLGPCQDTVMDGIRCWYGTLQDIA